MKLSFFILAILAVTLPLNAQTNGPVRLALVSDSDDAAAVVDVLTAQLTGNPRLQLVERDQIAKVYREQGLSAGNTDYLKLGQLLGADGLLLLQAYVETVKTNSPGPPPQIEVLHIQLVAVKPGVILAAQQFSWMVQEGPMEWATNFASRMDDFIPKLSVHTGDAIPLSVVNIRSAINSSEARDTERQLKSLTIERLAREPQLFVLERQRMDLLSEEKDLKMDDSAFWNGSYLLDGVVDQNGYSPDTITINARLTPPKGGAPLLLAVSGSRTNLAEVINQLATQVDAALKIRTVIPEWNAADEATQYFLEAKWALRWGLYDEAQAAAESAWALGKRDLACGQVRIQACLQELSATTCHYQNGNYLISSGYKEDGTPLGPVPSDARVQETIKTISATYKNTVVVKVTEGPGSRDISYLYPDKPPETGTIDRAIHALELYDEFSHASPDGQPQILSRGKGWNDWHNSDWYQLGIDDLVAASKVLQSFNFSPELQTPVADELAELRERARAVAGMIATAPSVHDSYFVGDRIVSRDELNTTMLEHDTIFRCQLDWGGYWQETPEAVVVLDRELMASPVFCYLHHDLWDPAPPMRRLVAWNEADEKRLPDVWNDFVRELGESTNVLWQMEAKALALADAGTKEQSQTAHDELMNIIRTHRQELVENNVELFYLHWGLDDPSGELESMDQEYWQTTCAGKAGHGAQTAFEKEKDYLKNNTPYDFPGFMKVFDYRDYTKAQAAEILPLLEDYESNLVAQAAGKAFPAPFQARSNCGWVEAYVATQARNSLNPKPTPPPVATVAAVKPVGPPLPQPVVHKILPRAPVSVLEIVTNVLAVNKFLTIPLEGLPGDQISGVTITAHHWQEGKLLLDFQYAALVYTYDEQGNWQGTRNATLPAIAILDPETEHWEVIPGPEADITTQNQYYHHSTLWHGEVFNSNGGQIRKYDFTQRQWQALPVSSGENFELFAVDDRLFAANANLIFEILEGGKSSRIIASTRRQPPVSVLDTQDFGTPSVDAGPNHSLRISTRDKAFIGTGDVWREVPAGSPAWNLPPTLSAENLPSVLWESNLYLLAGRVLATGPAGRQDQAGYDASLLCLSRDLPEPVKVYLKFDAPGACPPVSDKQPNLPPIFASHVAMQFAGHDLLLAAENSFIGMPMPGVNPGTVGPRAGIWRLPLAQLEPAIVAARHAQKAKLAQAAADVKRIHADLLAKYDLNHNGVIDPEEREAALNDPAFIESALDEIDTNHNGWLDPPELAWFDANQDKFMEPKEHAGMDMTIHLLAEKLLNHFDTKGNGTLDMMDYNAMIHASIGPNANVGNDLWFDDADENRQGQIDLGGLEDLMRRHLINQLRPRHLPRPFGNALSQGDFRPADPRRDFREAVEAYWRHPGGLVGGPTFNPGFAPTFRQGNPP
jgi:hypothetical protein